MLLLWGCGDSSNDVYEVRGRVVDLDFGGLALRVDHEPIPGYMDAMRMSFRLANPEDAHAVRPGDAIQFLYVVSESGSFIRDIEILPPDTELDLPAEGFDSNGLAEEPDTTI